MMGDMTTAHLPAGLSAPDLTDWASSPPAADGPFRPVSQAVSAYLVRGQELAGRLPDARAAINGIMNGARDAYLRAHTAGLYDALTGRCTKPVRMEDLVYRAAAEVPGLAPTRGEMDAERERMLAGQGRLELAQGLLVAHVLALPARRAGTWSESMLQPTPEALERLERAAGHRRGRPRPGARHPPRPGRHPRAHATRGISTPRTA